MSELINNSEMRQKKLKELIKSLHEGKTVEEVKAEFEKYFGDVSTTEISQIEQALVKEGLPIEEVHRLCDVHASVFKGSIADVHAEKDFSKIIGHPVNVFMEENKAIESLINEDILPQLESYLQKKDQNSILMLRIGFDRLSEINNHYARKEYVFFPYLEKHAITSPPKVMWGVDDEIRAEIKKVQETLSKPISDDHELKMQIEITVKKVLDMVFKENKILITLLSETLSLYEWIKIDEASQDFGYTLVKPQRSWKIENKDLKDLKEEKKIKDDVVEFDAGHLTQEELNAILNTIPIDLTFVDSDNKVKYFSQAKERIFQRPKSILGREVSLCHPPASVAIVENIIKSFRSGEKNHEDFWIKMGTMFVYIRYFAIRNNKNEYLGTLEITQNIKPITELQGEKRLVEK